MLTSECSPQTFFVVCRIAPSASACRQKTWISSARAINEQVIRRTSPSSGQRTLGKWHPMKSAATTHLSSSEKLPCHYPLLPIYIISLTWYDIYGRGITSSNKEKAIHLAHRLYGITFWQMVNLLYMLSTRYSLKLHCIQQTWRTSLLYEKHVTKWVFHFFGVRSLKWLNNKNLGGEQLGNLVIYIFLVLDCLLASIRTNLPCPWSNVSSAEGHLAPSLMFNTVPSVLPLIFKSFPNAIQVLDDSFPNQSVFQPVWASLGVLMIPSKTDRKVGLQNILSLLL